MVLAAIVGLGAGLAAVGFSVLVELSDRFFFDVVKDEWLAGLPGARLILIPVIGGLLVGPITHLLAPGARGHAIPEVMAALDSRGGRLSSTDAVARMAAATLTIGSGGAVGRQGPVVFLGAAFGSLAGRALRLNDQTMRLLATAGAAGGVAGIFNAPIAGVFFVVDDAAEPSNAMAQLRVSDAMAPLMESFGPTATLDEITLAFEGDPDPIALVVRENGDIHGIITGADIGEALNLFTSQRLRALPVVEADSPRRPAGLLRRAGIMRAYAEAVDRRASRDRRLRLRPALRSDNVRYLELRVAHESSLRRHAAVRPPTHGGRP